MFLFRLIQNLDRNRISYALVGGYAVALQGAVRGTVDIDLAVRFSKRDFIGLEKTLQELGLESRLPVTAAQVFEFREEYVAGRNLIAWNFYNPKNPVETVDILLTEDLAEMKVDTLSLGDLKLRVASIDELIRMKAAAGRPQDQADIEALKKLRAGKRKGSRG